MNQFRLMLALAGLLMIPGAVGYCEEMAQPTAEQMMPAENEVAVKAVNVEVAQQGVLADLMEEYGSEAPEMPEAEVATRTNIIQTNANEDKGVTKVISLQVDDDYSPEDVIVDTYPPNFFKPTDLMNPTPKLLAFAASNILGMNYPGYISGSSGGILGYFRDADGDGVADLDSDGDGVADGDDSYPGNPVYWGN